MRFYFYYYWNCFRIDYCLYWGGASVIDFLFIFLFSVSGFLAILISFVEAKKFEDSKIATDEAAVESEKDITIKTKEKLIIEKALPPHTIFPTVSPIEFQLHAAKNFWFTEEMTTKPFIEYTSSEYKPYITFMKHNVCILLSIIDDKFPIIYEYDSTSFPFLCTKKISFDKKDEPKEWFEITIPGIFPNQPQTVLIHFSPDSKTEQISPKYYLKITEQEFKNLTQTGTRMLPLPSPPSQPEG